MAKPPPRSTPMIRNQALRQDGEKPTILKTRPGHGVGEFVTAVGRDQTVLANVEPPSFRPDVENRLAGGPARFRFPAAVALKPVRARDSTSSKRPVRYPA